MLPGHVVVVEVARALLVISPPREGREEWKQRAVERLVRAIQEMINETPPPHL